MKLYSFISILLVGLVQTACDLKIPDQAQPGDIQLFPDYESVTIPVNIAPLNFRFLTDDTKGITLLKTSNKELKVEADKGVFNIPASDWKDLLQDAQGKEIQVSVYFTDKTSSWKRKDFPIYVSSDSIDAYLTYRRIFPGYRMWNEMGIYQRCVENFVEKPVITNQYTNNSCLNCHSFCQQNGDKWSFHQRAYYNGTYLIEKDQIKKITLEKNGQAAAFVYPYWHPSGKYIAFSTNETHQDFHFSDPNRIEVYDESSDILIYDLEKEIAYSTPWLNSSRHFETFPTFTPDGKALIYCSADSVAMPDQYREVKYNLLKVSFNPENGEIGSEIDTLYNARKEGRSIKFPRTSPDGKYLLYTISDYGNFSIWHKDADLRLLHLDTFETDSLKAVNSPDVESYHSWSSNGHWFVFSSRRLDGLFTRPFIAHIDSDGKASKPFLLPQESPAYYDNSLFSFNIPEFSKTPIRLSQKELVQASKEMEAKVIPFVCPAE